MAVNSPVPDRAPGRMASFDRALPVAGLLAGALCALALSLLAARQGLPPWTPLNATSHLIHGPAAAIPDLNWTHTAPGGVIHFASAFFWAAIAVLLLRLLGGTSVHLAWIFGLGTAALAGIVDYGLMPARLTPGWELILMPVEVALGFLALGIGLSLGLIVAGTAFSNTGSNHGERAGRLEK